MRCFTDKIDETGPGAVEASDFLDQFEIGNQNLSQFSAAKKLNK